MSGPEATDEWLAGRNVVREALERQLEGQAALDKVMVADDPSTQRWWSRVSGLARQAGTPVVRSPRSALDRLVPGTRHQGVVARRAARAFDDLDAVLDGASSPALLVLVDHVEDPRNLGALVRSAAAAGADGVLVPERHAAGLTAGASRAAAGALDRIPIARVKNATRGLEAVSRRNIWTLGLDAEGPPLWEADLERPTCLVVGAEGRGLSRLVRERVDVLGGLPLARGVESLNAAVAAGIALFEARRQRLARGPS